MYKTSYKFRIHPTAAQVTLLSNALEHCRWVYNETIALKKKTWEEQHTNLSKYDTFNVLPDWKQAHPELQTVHSQVLQNVQERVDLAFRGFFRRIKTGITPGFPRFKGVGQFDSFTFPHVNKGLFKGDCICVPKIGDIPVTISQPIDQSATFSRMTVKRAIDKWFVVLVAEQSSKKYTCGVGTVGIDLGCKSFVTCSDGTTIENPKFGKHAKQALDKARRKVHKTGQTNKENQKAYRALAKVHHKVENQRRDFLHKASRKLVTRYNTLVFEDLNIQQMVDGKPWAALNRTILDAGWGYFVSMCVYKAANAGGQVIKVDPRNTSKVCSKCGAIVHKELACRIHTCTVCDLVMDRDLNAAINVLRRGQTSLRNREIALEALI